MNSDALRPTPNTGRKALGKLATRLEEVKNPWRQVSALELSHSETARLATDALLESGEKEYRRVLSEEKELNFLSSLEIRYIVESVAKTASPENGPNGFDRDCGEGDTVSELTSGTYFPMMSDEEPPVLELGWPEVHNRQGPSETQIYFQRDKSQNIKDLIRSLINKAKKVIALVMDIFTDVDLFCDLLEASKKRKVPVYILLDEKNLGCFIDMCTELDIQNLHLNVHSNMILHFSGHITESFDREFRCLYADSQIIERFHNTDEEGLPHYFYNMVVPNMYVFQDRVNREKVSSENSSSQSSNSVSSVKAAPGFAPPVYKVTQEKKDSGNPIKGQERRDRGSPNGTLLAPTVDGPGSGAGPGMEWAKAGTPEFLRANLAGPKSKFQVSDSYDYKNLYHNSPKSSPHPQLPMQNKVFPKVRSPTNPFFNKFTDLFTSSSKEKDSSNFQRSPAQSTTFGGPDLSQNEPESIQGPPPPGPMPKERTGPDTGILRRDVKRMTLGHSKLDLVNHYNKMNPKQVYSRFELKNNNLPH
ncbi:hypothetical protein P4O66_001157 [Electrophorus voltai]|uniref:Scaffolding anchor of CK1 domain-containing protein n=1 Tax=Electrophorus voltai TaxID=2609070 RepID=A0AAD9DWS0_9TELE|nr:hypothetical protein P4O66_001157 [Electrophorus voltai]